MKRFSMLAAVLFMVAICLAAASESRADNGDVSIFKKVDRGNASFYMELLIKNPTRVKVEILLDSLLREYGKRNRLQIDVFDSIEALRRRADETYPINLVYKHWLVSITNDKIHRFYIKERPDIK